MTEREAFEAAFDWDNRFCDYVVNVDHIPDAGTMV
jgi:hypothetical protein